MNIEQGPDNVLSHPTRTKRFDPFLGALPGALPGSRAYCPITANRIVYGDTKSGCPVGPDAAAIITSSCQNHIREFQLAAPSNREPSTAPSEVPSVSSTPATSAVLGLPLEIRRTIYYYALLPPPDYRQVLRPLRAKRPNSWWGTREMTWMLRINKQLHHEMEQILYSSFEFSFLDTHPYNIRGFLEFISPRARCFIRHVSCSINMNGRIRDSIRRDYIENWKACFEVMCEELPGLLKVALRFRFLGGPATSSMKVTFVESMMDLKSVFRSEQEVSLLPYDGNTSVDKQGVEIVEHCRKTLEWPSYFPKTAASRLMSL